jgi:hypothetical protein
MGALKRGRGGDCWGAALPNRNLKNTDFVDTIWDENYGKINYILIKV